MLVSECIARATRRLFAGQELTATENTAALENFQAMMRDLPVRIGAQWTDVEGTDGYTVGEDERVTSDDAITCVIPTYVYKDDNSGVIAGTTFDSTTMRRPKDGARVQIVAGDDVTERLWFYRADKAYWAEVGDLTVNSEVPLSSAFDMYLPSMLAAFMHDEYPGSVLGEMTVYLARQGYSKLRAKTRRPQVVAVDAALLNLSIQTGRTGRTL